MGMADVAAADGALHTSRVRRPRRTVVANNYFWLHGRAAGSNIDGPA
jgi:hypothetical protein